jgi:ubiquinone/menaquinone biosynthesis C-methylase UbiE
MLNEYFKKLYDRTIYMAYSLAHKEIVNIMRNGGKCLDCGAYDGGRYETLSKSFNLDTNTYYGIEWNAIQVEIACSKNLNVIQGDLNKGIDFPDNTFRCIFALSLLEHLLNPCRFLKECYRTLEEGGILIILTPNISTYFTALLILLGKMPSTGPHPDSDLLLKQEELYKVSHESLQPATETDTPVHRHLVVFSFRVLQSYLKLLGFKRVKGYGFGLYPFPNFMQPLLEKIDPYHCHQMVFIAHK